MTQAEIWQAPLFASATRTLYVVDLRCLACGRGRELTVGALADLPPLPERCANCGGSVLAVDSTTRIVRSAGPVDWQAGMPKRGRPPAHPRIQREEQLS